MKNTALTRTGLLLSVLPILTLIGIALFMVVSKVPSGVFLTIFALFSLFPLSLLYVVYVVVRFIRFSKDDPAFCGVRHVSVVLVASLLFPRLIGLMLYLLEMKLGLTDWLEIFSTLTTVLTYTLPFLVCPIAEAVLYWKMRSKQLLIKK